MAESTELFEHHKNHLLQKDVQQLMVSEIEEESNGNIIHGEPESVYH